MSYEPEEIKPWQVLRRAPGWVVASGIILALFAVTFVVLYVIVLAPAGNQIDKANQGNQLRHDQRQSAIINQENQNTYGSLAYQNSALQAGQQDLGKIEGPGGLAGERSSLAANDPQQQGLQDQEFYVIRDMCTWLVRVNPANPSMTAGSPSMNQIVAANCTAGTAKANAPLADNPVPGGGA